MKSEACGSLAAAFAEHGYAVFILPMPFNLAVFAIDRTAKVQAACPEITSWAVGRHSLGGAMVAEYAAQHPGRSALSPSRRRRVDRHRGGNHEQFGGYTGHLNTSPAAVMRQAQEAQAVAAATRLLGALSP